MTAPTLGSWNEGAAKLILRRLAEMAQSDPGLRDRHSRRRQTPSCAPQHPTLRRSYLRCAYLPLIEMLAYLDANGFSNYIASGGGRDFMRPISQEVYGIPRDRVIGIATALHYSGNNHGGTITHKAEADYLDDGPQKPIRIWSRTGRRPILVAGNSPTATSRCSSSPGTRTSGRFAC